MTYCDNIKCEHNKNLVCILPERYIVDDSCVSRRKKPECDNYQELMRVQSSGCLRNNGKFKNKHGTVLK